MQYTIHIVVESNYKFDEVKLCQFFHVSAISYNVDCVYKQTNAIIYYALKFLTTSYQIKLTFILLCWKFMWRLVNLFASLRPITSCKLCRFSM